MIPPLAASQNLFQLIPAYTGASVIISAQHTHTRWIKISHANRNYFVQFDVQKADWVSRAKRCNLSGQKRIEGWGAECCARNKSRVKHQWNNPHLLPALNPSANGW